MSEDCSVHVVVGRILHVEFHSEVYHPQISFVRSESPAPKPEIVPEPTLDQPAPLATTVEKLESSTTKPVLKRRSFKTLFAKLGTIITATIAILAVAIVGLKIAGFRTFTVLSGSMEPEYPVGAMIYVKPTDYKTLKVGDVISYVANNDKTIVTHRIVSIEKDTKDPETLRFKTQGDANASADANLVHYKNILGTPVLTIPHLGYIAHNIQQPPGIYITLVVGTLLLAWTFLPGTLEERRKTTRKSVV